MHLKETKDDTGVKDRKYVDFLDILLTAKDENGTGLTREETRNEVDTFLFEGMYTYRKQVFHCNCCVSLFVIGQCDVLTSLSHWFSNTECDDSLGGRCVTVMLVYFL